MQFPRRENEKFQEYVDLNSNAYRKANLLVSTYFFENVLFTNANFLQNYTINPYFPVNKQANDASSLSIFGIEFSKPNSTFRDYRSRSSLPIE